jgi:signal transduction histidine kinase
VVRRLLPASLRAQLALAIVVVTGLALGVSFIALYNGTAARMRAQIDAQLETQLAEWRQSTAAANLSTPRLLEQTAARFIAGQRYHAESLLIVVQPLLGRTVSNHPDLVALEDARERGAAEGARLLDSPLGLSTASVAEAGSMRVLASRIVYRGHRVGTLRLANPLTPVQQAQSSLLRTFAIVGSISLLVAIAVGLGLANLIAAPLRRMARTAAGIEAGDLSLRVGSREARGEVGVLASAFDHMLDRLERTFRRQRDFVSDASHELRTPLTVLRAQVEVLDRENDERRRHEGMETLLRRLDELDRLVADMLTLASAEAGQLIEPRPIELDEFFEDIRRDLPLFGRRDFRLQAVGGTLQGDPDRLTQVLRNLVRNAVAHTDPDDQVLVSAHATDGQLEIEVADTGPGIPPDQLELVFERFHRVDGGRSRDRGGSGLGLAIARAITEAHGGTIYAESAPGRGATFHVQLPGYSPPLPR